MAIQGEFVIRLFPFFSYCRERFPLRVFAPVACILVLSILFASQGIRSIRGTDALGMFWVTLLFLLCLRIQDDLLSIQEDRDKIPRRIVTTPGMDIYFKWVLMFLLFSLSLWIKWGVYLKFLGLFVFIEFWKTYWNRATHTHLLHWSVPLLKYPLVAFLGAEAFRPGLELSFPLLLTMITVWGLFIFYEVVHDKEKHV